MSRECRASLIKRLCQLLSLCFSVSEHLGSQWNSVNARGLTVDPTKTNATGFLVKNWTAQVQGYYYSPTAVDDFIYRFQSSTPSPYPEMVPDQSQYGDLVRLTGIPGQGNADPAEKIFGNHGIVQYGSTTPTFYDPSYGVTYSVSSFGADFEQGLSGYYMTSPLDDLGDFRVSLGPPIGLGAIRFQYVR